MKTTENKERLFLSVEVFLAGFAVAFTALNRRKLSRLEKKIDTVKRDSNSILMFQSEKNNEMEREIEEVRDEVSSVYGHIVELLRIKEDGR